MKRRPARLRQGDTVGIVALGSPVERESLHGQLEFLGSLGLSIKLGETIELDGKYLAGKDEDRLNDLHSMIQDPEVKAIFNVRGGYGAARIADRIDYQSLTENPKIFWGFSDTTYLHTALQEYADIVTFHGPMLSPVGASDFSELSKRMFQQLFNPFEIQYDETLSPLKTIVSGSVRGEVTGGNLRRLVETLGTKFEFDARNKILVLEDMGETVENIDSMLNQLRLSRKLEAANGFAIGSFTGMADGTLEEVYSLFEEYLKPLGKPAVGGFMIGHCEPNVAIPLGVEAILDADGKVLRLLPGVE